MLTTVFQGCYYVLVRTFVGASAIHGNGVFAAESIAAGTVVWRFEPIFDRVISDDELHGMPSAFCDYLNMYAYRSSDIGGRLLLPCDHAKFLNHSADPNTKSDWVWSYEEIDPDVFGEELETAALRPWRQRLLDDPRLVVLRPAPPPLQPAQNLDPHRLMILKLDLRCKHARKAAATLLSRGDCSFDHAARTAAG
jgi:hypothetical protein